MFLAPLLIGLMCIVLLGKKNRFTISWFFVMVWSFFCTLACFGFYGLNKPNFIIVLLSCLSIIIFTLTSFIKYPLITIGKYSYDKSEKPPTFKWRLYIFNIFAYVFSVPYLLKSINILKSRGIYFVRNAAFEGGEGIGSTAILMVFQYIVSPLFLATIIVTAIDVFDKNIKYMAVIFSVIDVLMYTFLFAGRFTLLNFVIIFLFASIDSGKVKNIWNLVLKHKKLVLFLGVFIAGLIIMTSLRTSNSFIKSLYVYFSGSFSYLPYLVDNNIGTNLYLHGKTFLGFIYNSIYLALTFLFGVKYNGSNHIITQLTQYMVFIGDNIRYNSLATMLHDFMADFGVFGSLFGVLIYSIICNYAEKIRYKKDTYFAKAVYYYLVLSVVLSTLSYSFRGPGALFCLIFLYIFCYQRKNTYDSNINGE